MQGIIDLFIDHPLAIAVVAFIIAGLVMDKKGGSSGSSGSKSSGSSSSSTSTSSSEQN